jgi:hypothetical protein
MLTAQTVEVDDVDKAVEGILGQLDIEKNLLRHTVGILFCHQAFVESGIVGALCARLPFETIGCTTQGIVMPRATGGIMLGLAVLTSDAAGFATGVSEPLLNGAKEKLFALYRRVSARLAASPSLILACQPLLDNLAGTAVVEALDGASGGVPLFGSVALDLTTKNNLPMTIHNGVCYRDRLALLLIAGDIDTRFFVEWFPRDRVMSTNALITKAERNRIVEINNLPALDYIGRLGIVDGGHDALCVMPLLITSPEGKHNTIACIGVDGNTLICGDIIPLGGTMNFGEINNDDVLDSVSRIAHMVKHAFFATAPEMSSPSSANALPNGAGLIFSCISRSSALADPLAEMALMHQHMRDVAAPYCFAYSGGELSSWRSQSDNTQHNRFYQYAIIACVISPSRA